MAPFDDIIREHLELKRRQGASGQDLDQLEAQAFGSSEPSDKKPAEARESEARDDATEALAGPAHPHLPVGGDSAEGPAVDDGPAERSPLAEEHEVPAFPDEEAGPVDGGEALSAVDEASAEDPPLESLAPIAEDALPDLEPPAPPAQPEFDLSNRSFEIPDPVPDVTFPEEEEEEAAKQAGFEEKSKLVTAEDPPAQVPAGARVAEWTALEPEPGLEPLVEHEESAALESITAEPVSPATASARRRHRGPGRIARSTAFFAFATGLSRIAGLVREIVAASFFGVKGVMSAFTIAFQIPNLIRSLFADAAIQAAFVPVFTEDLEHNRRLEAFRLASNLLFVAILVLGVMSALLVLLAPVIVPVFAPGFEGNLGDLTVSLSRILFPIVALLGVSGLVVGILNSFHRFGILAISPFFWNVAIIAVLVGLAPAFPEENKIYAYAIGVLVGTILQLGMVTWDLRNTPFRAVGVRISELWTPGVKRVLVLMLPVAISLGLINFNLVINSLFGTLVSPRAPASIDKAFRIYMLPQGMFSVAVATVVFPTLARFAARRAYDDLRATMANGMRMIVLLLVPAAAAILVLAEPMTRLIYERGEFGPAQTELVATALFWFAFALPLNGLFLLLARTFFSLQRPWVPSAIAAANLAITAGAAAALYSRYEIAGIVAATVIATGFSVIAQVTILRRQLRGLQLGQFISATARVLLAAGALAGITWLVWNGLDGALGESLAAQIVAVGAAVLAGTLVYAVTVLGMQVPEAHQIMRLIRGRSVARGSRPPRPTSS